MTKLNKNPLQWCQREFKLAGSGKEVCVSLYFMGDQSPGFTVYEMGVALIIGEQTRRIPLNFTAEAVLTADQGGMYDSYSALADDYVNHLIFQGIPARRVLAEFELLLRRNSPTSTARS
jgi:hypothetical protein